MLVFFYKNKAFLAFLLNNFYKNYVKNLSFFFLFLNFSCHWKDISITDDLKIKNLVDLALKREMEDTYSYNNYNELIREVEELKNWRLKNLNEAEKIRLEEECESIKEYFYDIKPIIPRDTTKQVLIDSARNNYLPTLRAYLTEIEELSQEASLMKFKEDCLKNCIYYYAYLKESYILYTQMNYGDYISDVGINLNLLHFKKNKLLKKLIYRFPYLSLEKMSVFSNF